MPTPFAAHRILLGRYAGRYRGRFIWLGVLLLGSVGLQLLAPQIVRAFLEQAQSGGGAGVLLAAAGAYLLAALAQRALALASSYWGASLSWAAANDLRLDLTAHALSLPMGFHKEHTPGELIERIDGDVNALGSLFSDLILRLGAGVLLVAGALVLLLREDLRLGLGLAAYAAVAFLLLGWVQGLASRHWHAERERSADQYGYLEERLGAREDIHAVGAAEHAAMGLERRLATWAAAARGAWFVQDASYLATSLLRVTGYLLAILLATWLYAGEGSPAPAAFLAASYVGLLAGPLDEIRQKTQELGRAGAGVERIVSLLKLAPSPDYVEPAAHLPPGALSVECDGVDFAYDDGGGESVLHDLTWSAQPGSITGLLGRTGSGKTTLSRLLYRLYEPQSGVLRLGGVDIRNVPRSELGRRVGVVTQEVQLFAVSLRENLAFFDPEVDDERLQKALEQLGLWEWVLRLPERLDTRVGPGGHGFSAGEAQLVAFTRLLLKDPGLVVLDEASSRLDPDSERLLDRAIARLLEGRTALVIAHRLQTVTRADCIVILSGGRIVEAGPRAALAADQDSHFAGLLRAGIQEVLE